MDKLTKPFIESVAEKLIEQLREGVAPWQKPWQPGDVCSFLPINTTTGKRYKGINAIHLMSQGRSDQHWMTYKQAEAVGAQVRKGEKGTPIQYWKFNDEQIKTDADDKPVLDANGDPIKTSIKLERPSLFFATVFNAEQIDGLPQQQARKEPEWTALERAEKILRASGAVIHHGERDRAFYRPATDTVHLPDKGQFLSADSYYATALHELGHWSGHASRLNRDLVHPFGSEGYAREELRAEIASMILGDELGIGHDPKQHAAYVGSWIKALQDDPLEIFRAAADAEKIQSLVLGFEHQQLRDSSIDVELTDEEAEVARARFDLLSANASSPEQAALEYNAIADEHLGFTLPHDWTGKVLVQGNIHDAADHDAVSAEAMGRRPDFWSVYAQRQGAEYHRLTDFDRKAAAEGLAGRLSLIAAHSEVDELEKAAKLARIREEKVRGDPNSTDEDKVAAKEARKGAEFKAAHNDADLQRHISEQERALVTTPASCDGAPTEQSKPSVDKFFINVPFKQKDEAKALGAKWDRQQQLWFIPAGLDTALFEKFARGGAGSTAGSQQPAQPIKSGEQSVPLMRRQFLAVPYSERTAAKAAGAEWDKAAKSWFAGTKADMTKLARWMPENVQAEQGPAMSPREEFAEALRMLGCVVAGEHPIMDGQKHRISVEGEAHSKHSGSGFYVGHVDGHPAGYIKNNKTGVDMNWKSKGYVLEPGQKAALQLEVAAKLAAREARHSRLRELAAQRVQRQVAELIPIVWPTPYLAAKGIEPQPGIYTDKDGKTTYIPAIDVNGKQWTMQYISEDGKKRFAKDSQKEACFHVVGGLDALVGVPALVISEGYATASSLSQSLGFATIAAFDSGNLPHVARALHERFPTKPVVVAGDNDVHLEATLGTNPGRSKAIEAARSTGGTVVLPIFAPGEQAGDPRGFTDFNDLATKSALGREGLDRQVCSFVSAVIEKQSPLSHSQGHEPRQQHPSRALKIG